MTFGLGKATHARITAVGCGGAGCNIVREVAGYGLPGLDPVLLNRSHELKVGHLHDARTIALELDRLAPEPHHAEKAAWLHHDTLSAVFRESNLVFIVSGLGGATGSGALPAVAEISRAQRKVTVALTLHPFGVEGPRRMKNVEWCMERLGQRAHGVLSIHNQKLMAIAPDISFGQALQVTNRMAIMPIQEIAEVATRSDLPNVRRALDCEDLHIGFGGSDRDKGLYEAVDEVVESLMPGPVDKLQVCDRALVTVRSGPMIREDEVEHLAGCISAEIHSRGRVLWGSIRDDAMEDRVRIMAILGNSRGP